LARASARYGSTLHDEFADWRSEAVRAGLVELDDLHDLAELGGAVAHECGRPGRAGRQGFELGGGAGEFIAVDHRLQIGTPRSGRGDQAIRA
jgi:hypothetical protein